MAFSKAVVALDKAVVPVVAVEKAMVVLEQ